MKLLAILDDNQAKTGGRDDTDIPLTISLRSRFFALEPTYLNAIAKSQSSTMRTSDRRYQALSVGDRRL